MKLLYKFKWDCGRLGEVEGVFVADPEAVKGAIGSELYFGEILGKHSEIYGPLDEGDILVVTDDQGFIQRFEELKCESGYNPLGYLREFECEVCCEVCSIGKDTRNEDGECAKCASEKGGK